MTDRRISKTFTIDIAAPVARVWEEITRSGSRCRPMFGTMLFVRLEAGAPLRYRSVDGRHTFVAGEIVEAHAPHRLVHTFVFPNLPDAPTLVTWELAAQGEGTRVTVVHERFEGETQTFRSAVPAWPKILGLFKRVIETGDVGRGTKLQHALMGACGFLLPKSLRTDVVEAKLAAEPPRVR
jgi:uncharacterized protein YndB with AHSA1/START domain